MTIPTAIIQVTRKTLELGAFQLTATGLVIRGAPSFDEWQRCGGVLQRVEGACQWWIGDWVNYGAAQKAWGVKYTEAVDALGIPKASLKIYAHVAQRFQSFRRLNDVPFSTHLVVAVLPAAEQDAILRRVRKEKLSLREVRAIVKAKKRARHLAAAIWPEGQYAVILADPPWRPDEGLLDPTRQIENQYPTMTLEELIELADYVESLALPDCVLLMWTTAQKISEATQVLEAWGFVVKSGAVWVKPSIGMGYWFRQRHELLILATRGDPPTPLEADRPDSVMDFPRTGHSEKPDDVYALIERMFPQVPKVELFARAERPGWAHGTNEIALRTA